MKSRSYYKTIYECPISEWILAKESLNNEFLKKKSLWKLETEIDKDNSDHGNVIFISLLDQIWLKFGQDEKTKEILDLKKELIELYEQMIQDDERFNINYIEPLEDKLRLLEKPSTAKKIKFSEEIGAVSKNFGELMNPKKVTIYEYLIAASTL